MNLNELAESDLALTLEDKITGFATDIILTVGNDSIIVQGSYNSINKSIDPTTGLIVISQNPTVVVRKSTLEAQVTAGNIPNLPTKNDWEVDLTYNNEILNYFIQNVKEDKRLGTLTFVLTRNN